MKTLRLALAQVNPTVGDLYGNASKAISYINKAEGWGADFVVFPEMLITGYPPQDLLLKSRFIAKNLEQTEQVASQTKKICAIYGFVDKKGDDIYNAAALAYGGRLIGVYHKIFPQTYGVLDEARYFKRGKSCPIFFSPEITIGVNIGNEIEHQDGPAMLQAISGAGIILSIDASPYYVGKHTLKKKMLSKIASDYGVFLAHVNMVGGQDELVFDGGSMVFDPGGKLIAMGRQFEEELVLVDLEIEENFKSPLKPPDLQVERLVFDLSLRKDRPPLPHQETTPLDPIEEIYQALVLGTRDYVKKNGFEKVVIGLSGGIDSSLVACIATDALGPENVVGVSMPSRFSSPESIKDAEELCSNLGIKLLFLPIDQAFSAFLEILKEPFRGTGFGVAEENIQARSRANILMSLSNKFGWLVLTTGNKSEFLTGYFTLGGDSLGGFAVLKDVPKTMVYELARYKNKSAGREIIPRSVFEKPPSAELRPGQKDTDTLPPYEILDPILKAYIDEGEAMSEIVSMGFPEEVVRKVILMVDRSEYKRRQAPVGIKITHKERRLPIVNRFYE